MDSGWPGLLRLQCFLEVPVMTRLDRDGDAACVLQQGSQGFMGLFGPSRDSAGLVCPYCSV
jgi:hypothetical protein